MATSSSQVTATSGPIGAYCGGGGGGGVGGGQGGSHIAPANCLPALICSLPEQMSAKSSAHNKQKLASPRLTIAIIATVPTQQLVLF